MNGTVTLLNVAAGDITLNLTSAHPAERIRAARIITSMIRQGYALLVEVERDGEKRFERALDFDENANTYLIADYDPMASERRADEKAYGEEPVPDMETDNGQSTSTETPAPAESTGTSPKKRGRPKRVRIDAASTRAVAVGRSAGG